MIEDPTTQTLRCFVAIASPLTEAARPLIDELKSLSQTEHFRLRLAPPENLHITMKFIGNVDVNQVGLLDSILRHQSNKQTAFQVNCQGIGFFENTLYMGIAENDVLRQFVTELNQAFTFLGYSIEDISFLPHITLARFATVVRPELMDLLEAYRYQKWGSMNIESVQLFRSETLAEGARYTAIGNYPLLT